MADYLDENLLKKEIANYQSQVKKDENNKIIYLPEMNDVFGNMFLELTKRISQRNNFKNYTNLEEMRQEACIKCIRAVPNFDLNRGTKAFSFFTQIVWMSFLQDIKGLVKKAKEIPVEFIEEADSINEKFMFSSSNHESNGNYN